MVYFISEKHLHSKNEIKPFQVGVNWKGLGLGLGLVLVLVLVLLFLLINLQSQSSFARK